VHICYQSCKHISKVLIHHPSQVSPEQIKTQMSTMTKSYGLKAVGRAAAATVMLPLAVGVDLVILPGPQVGHVSAFVDLVQLGAPLSPFLQAGVGISQAAVAVVLPLAGSGSGFGHPARAAGRKRHTLHTGYGSWVQNDTNPASREHIVEQQSQ
jgi:hypothetical protein